MTLLVSTEKDIQAACLQWLNYIPNVVAWRQNTGGVHWQDKAGKNRYQRIGEPGQSDILGMAFGVMMQIEIKKPGKTPFDKQIEWMGMIRAHGGIAFWTDSLAWCCTQLRAEFENRGWEWNRSLNLL